jgi:hypothetical protein
MTTQGKKRAIRIAGTAILLIALLIIFPRQKLIEALASIPSSTLAAAVPIYVALHLVGSLKWLLMVNSAGAQLPVSEALRCYFGGLFSNLFLPSVIGGDIVTMTLGISRAPGREAVVSGTFASRVIDLAALALLIGVAVLGLPREINSTGRQLIQLVFAVLICASILGGLALFLLRTRIRGRAIAYWNAFASAWRRPGSTLAALALSVIMQAGLIALSAWIGVGCGLHLPASAWLFAWPLAKLSGFVPVTLAGIGSRELVLPALLAPFGADRAASASVGLAWDAVLIIGSLIGGAISKTASLAQGKPS